MPHCYFVNSHRHILERKDGGEKTTVRRETYGLPPSPAFVFCCHSRPDKIDPSTFATWIRALKRTRSEGRKTGNTAMADAVLWLLKSDGGMEANLRAEALAIFGKDDKTLQDSSLVFCDKAPRQEHLERLALADVFLDTPSYNAHTVGCDCLGAGVPMISLLRPWHRDETEEEKYSCDSNGEAVTFVPTEKLASRVGASLLKSAGFSSFLSDGLVVASMEEYEDRMVECARSSSSSSERGTDEGTLGFASYKQHLLEERSRAPLWDTERWVRNLETGLATMVDLQRKGSCETDIYIMDYSNVEPN
jgi:protein O-GlcNAc transferase